MIRDARQRTRTVRTYGKKDMQYHQTSTTPYGTYRAFVGHVDGARSAKKLAKASRVFVAWHDDGGKRERE